MNAPMSFARIAHAGQFRAGPGKVPYIEHPIRVANLVASFYEGDDLQSATAAALLHDVIEDCGVTFEQLDEKFGGQVATLVEQLSKPSFLAKSERSDWLIATAWKLHPDAADVKCADRADNLLSMIGAYPGEQIKWGDKRKAEYLAEAEALYERLVNARPLARQLLMFAIAQTRKALS